MSWSYLPELVEGFSQVNCSDTGQSAQSKSTHTAVKYYSNGKEMESCPRFPFGMTFEILTANSGVEKWISSLLESRANRSQLQDGEEGKKTVEICGRTPSVSFAKCDPGTRSWRTSQGCLLTGTFTKYSASWPKAGLMQSGECYLLKMLEPFTNEKESGLLPTPTARDSRTLKGAKRGPNAVGSEPLVIKVGGTLNPPWVEWLMGWPSGWTALQPLEMDKYQSWLRVHSKFFRTNFRGY